LVVAVAHNTFKRFGFDETPDNYALLGMFIEHYARVERTVHLLFRYCTGTMDDIARIVAGGMRLSDLIKGISQLAASRGLGDEFKTEIDACFNQLSAISKLRDVLVHRGTIPQDDGDLISTNLYTAKTREAVEVLRISPEDIADAINDCLVLRMRLERLTFPPGHWARSADASEILCRPWLYKHRQPVNPLKPA
jgi:hypothetical protein